MPAPYSDNLYSEQDPAVSGPSRDDNAAGHHHDDALSPSDGYFHASADDDASAVSPTSHIPPQPTQPTHRSSASVPYIPNILVEDPTLAKDPDSKAQIAQRLINSDLAAPSAPSTSSPHHPQHDNARPYFHYPSASPSVSGASVATPSTITPSHTRQPSSYTHTADGSQQNQLHINTSHHQQHQPSRYQQHSYNHQGDAPPAYTPSSPDNNPSNYTYATFPSSTSPRMGVPEEHDRLLSPQYNQSQQPFGDPPKQPLWQRIKDSHDSGSLRKRVKKILGFLVVLSIVLVLFGVNMSGPKYRKHIIDKSPIRIPDMGESEIVWNPTRSCRDTPHTLPKRTFHPSIASDRLLSIEQTIRRQEWDEPHAGRTPHVNGEVILRPTHGKAAMDVEIISNYENMDIDVEFDTSGHADHLRVTTPRLTHSDDDRTCIQIRITAWLPEKALVNALNIAVVSLNVVAREGLSLGAEKAVDIATVSGNILLPSRGQSVEEPYKLESPVYQYTTVAGDIKGWLPSYHKLKISTVSGDVTSSITQKDIVLQEHLPTLLQIESISGKLYIDNGIDELIDAHASEDKIPKRDYLVKIGTTSGDVEARLFTGSNVEFASTSGALSLELLPLLDERWLNKSWRPRLVTGSISGNHRVQINEPILTRLPDDANHSKRPSLPKSDNKGESGKKSASPQVHTEQTGQTEIKRRRTVSPHTSRGTEGLAAFESEHDSISGNMKLWYPASWQGNFRMEAMSSSLLVRGKDVVVDKNKKGWVSKEVAGHKGDGKSSIKIAQMSGNVDLQIGSD